MPTTYPLRASDLDWEAIADESLTGARYGQTETETQP